MRRPSSFGSDKLQPETCVSPAHPIETLGYIEGKQPDTHLRAISDLDIPLVLISLILPLTSSLHSSTTLPFPSLLSRNNGACSSPLSLTLSPPSHLSKGGMAPVVWLGADAGGEWWRVSPDASSETEEVLGMKEGERSGGCGWEAPDEGRGSLGW